jgi:hypothetical protein
MGDWNPEPPAGCEAYTDLLYAMRAKLVEKLLKILSKTN